MMISLDRKEERIMEKKKRHRILKWLAALSLVTGLCAAAVIFYRVNEFQIWISLEGQSEMNWEYGTSFEDPGAKAFLCGRYLLKEGKEIPLRMEGSVDTETLDSYSLSYAADFLWLQGQSSRTVTVVDTQAPVITLVRNSVPEPNKPYVEEGYKAVDNHDGDVTEYVVRAEKPGKIIYWVTDLSGNIAQEERTVPLIDSEPPVITLSGGQELHIPAGAAYEEPGYQAVDLIAGDVTDRVTVEGEVDGMLPGTYPITYRAKDDLGNQAELVRNIVVDPQPRPQVRIPEQKTIYLTFDDGPGPYTDFLLDVLARYGVKATFFVVDTGYPAQMRRIVEEGHSIALHSVTHDYRQIYASREAFFEDLLGIRKIVQDTTGVTSTLMRFPGGSSNLVSSFNPGIMSELTVAVQDNGFQYFDWNVDSNDAGGARTAQKVYENVIEGVRYHKTSVVLQHDIHPYSVSAVEKIILWGLEHGYQFLPLMPDSYGAHHGVNN